MNVRHETQVPDQFLTTEDFTWVELSNFAPLNRIPTILYSQILKGVIGKYLFIVFILLLIPSNFPVDTQIRIISQNQPQWFYTHALCL